MLVAEVVLVLTRVFVPGRTCVVRRPRPVHPQVLVKTRPLAGVCGAVLANLGVPGRAERDPSG